MVHFLGGVFVSPAPQVCYRYMLEQMAERGYLIVATPYAVDFDYRKPAAEVHEKFYGARTLLASEYGDALPLLGLGHSLGALMQTLLCCMYAEYAEACAGSALISWNNKPVSDAIPLFEQLFVPALSPLNGPLEQAVSALPGAAGLRRDGFGLLKQLAEPLSGTVGQLLGAPAEQALGVALADAEVIAALVDQLPEVLASVSRGTAEFTPDPAEVRALIKASYPPRPPLVVQFEVDSLDESPALSAALPASAAASPLKLSGTHVTPLAIDPDASTSALLPLNALPDPLGLGAAKAVREALLADADRLVEEIDAHFGVAIFQAEAEARAAAAAAVVAPEAAAPEAVVPEAVVPEAAAPEAAAPEAAAPGAPEAALDDPEVDELQPVDIEDDLTPD